MKYELSNSNQQYQYFLEVNDCPDGSKQLVFSNNYEGARFPDDVQSKVEFFVNSDELNRLIDILNGIKD
jgi:hypothetical protein